MKKLSISRLAQMVSDRRKKLDLTQAALSEKTGISRSVLSRIELSASAPSVDQLLALASVLDFRIEDVIDEEEKIQASLERRKIAVAGTGYVGLSLSVLLSQHNDVTAVDILPEKVEMINSWKSPIRDEYIEKYMAEHEKRGLSLKATTDASSAYAEADYIIISAPTNYDPMLILIQEYFL